MYQGFVHLRTHSSYSLAEGAIKVEDLIELCIRNKMPAVAITDSGNLFCSLEFSKYAAANGIQPIIGCVIAIDPQIQDDKAFTNAAAKIDKIVLYAKDKTGYHNLLKLVSKSFLDSEGHAISHIKLSDLEQYHEGIIVLTGGIEGTLGRLLLESKDEQAEHFLLKLATIFGDRLYMELMRHNLEEEIVLEPKFIALAYKHNIPLVATNDAFFANKKMHEAHDVLLCIAEGKYLADEDRRTITKEHYFKTAKEMRELFADIPEAINNTLVIAKRCAVKAEESLPMLPNFTSSLATNEAEELKKLAREGLKIRLDAAISSNRIINNEETIRIYQERLEYELSIITDMNFSGYFLIVSDFITWAKKQNIPVGPGRGSGAGSLVAWALLITDLDPIRFGLLFERFLNPERISMPDFDIDFCQERRDEVISYVRNKYGKDRVAHIITFGKLQARAVIRDVGRVLQMPYSQVDKISKMVPFNAVNPVTLSQAIEMEPALKQARDEDEQVDRLLSIALQLEGLNRHVSLHAAGIVIAGTNLEELVPLYKDPKSEMLVVQYSLKYAEAAGLVKFDFLGLKTLTVIANCCKLVQERVSTINISEIPLDDEATYQLLSRGAAIGVFQFESPGMRETLRKMRPDTFEDLIALGALYRPGPMDNIPTYIARKHGLEQPDYLHTSLEKVLKETFGVIIYQEQVMYIAQILAGYTAGSADLLRRAMGKKIKAEMDAQREMFVSGAVKNGVVKEQASNIFDLVAKFAGYGFNKSHAAAYAMISYQTAYLKANYPIEFIVASMNLDIDDTDKISQFKEEALAFDIKILPPDINNSQAYFSICDDKTIYYGLGAIKNVGLQAMQLLVTERDHKGKYKDIFDFAARVDSKILNKRQLENLIKAGAFDLLNSNRKQLLESIDVISKFNSSIVQDRTAAQTSLFAAVSAQTLPLPSLKACQDWSEEERLQYESEALGFYLSSHPLEKLKVYLQEQDVKDAHYLNTALVSGFSTVKLSGIVSTTKTKVSGKGRFVSLLCSDYSGIYEVSIFDSNLLTFSRELFTSKIPLLITAEARKDDGGIKLTAQAIGKLDEFLLKKYNLVKIWIRDVAAISVLKSFCEQTEGSGMRIRLIIVTNQEEIEVDLPNQFSLGPVNSMNVETIAGVQKVQFVKADQK
jgi:DNA polymerase-3 subunit alpha